MQKGTGAYTNTLSRDQIFFFYNRIMECICLSACY